MYKVIFGVEKVSLNLDNVYCQVVIKKGKQTIALTDKVSLKQGLAFFDALNQFFVIQNDPLFFIQVLLMQNKNKKLGGQTSLNISDWDQNTHYSTVAKLDKSPDPKAAIFYTFTYYRSDKGILEKVIVLCNDMNENVLSKLKNQNQKLTIKNQTLQNDIQNLEKERVNLRNHEIQMQKQFKEKKQQHEMKIGEYINDLNRKNQFYQNQQKINNQMINLIYSLGNPITKQKLQKKYPHLINLNKKQCNENMNNLKRKKSTKSQTSKEQTLSEAIKEMNNPNQERERSRNKMVKS